MEQEFLTRDQVETFVKEIIDIIELCRDHPRAALAVATEGLSVSGSVHPPTSGLDGRDGVLFSSDVVDDSLHHSSSQNQRSMEDWLVDSSSYVKETATESIDCNEVCTGHMKTYIVFFCYVWFKSVEVSPCSVCYIVFFTFMTAFTSFTSPFAET